MNFLKKMFNRKENDLNENVYSVEYISKYNRYVIKYNNEGYFKTSFKNPKKFLLIDSPEFANFYINKSQSYSAIKNFQKQKKKQNIKRE